MAIQTELIRLYEKEGARTLYFSGVLHGLLDELSLSYGEYFAYGETLAAEFYDLTEHLSGGNDVEQSICQAIKNRFICSVVDDIGWGSLSPSRDLLKHMVFSAKVTVEFLADGGIYDSICYEAVGNYSFYTKEQHDSYKKKLYDDTKSFFDGVSDGLLGLQQPSFLLAPRYLVKIDPDICRHHSAFSWATHRMEAVVSNGMCILFIFGNSD